MFEYVVFYKNGRLIAYVKTEEEAHYLVNRFGGYEISDWRAFNKPSYEKKFNVKWDVIRELITDAEAWRLLAEGTLCSLPPF